MRSKVKEGYCRDCGTTESPLWRAGPKGTKTLCNACGIKWKRQQEKLEKENKRRKAGERKREAGNKEKSSPKPKKLVESTPITPSQLSINADAIWNNELYFERRKRREVSLCDPSQYTMKEDIAQIVETPSETVDSNTMKNDIDSPKERIQSEWDIASGSDDERMSGRETSPRVERGSPSKRRQRQTTADSGEDSDYSPSSPSSSKRHKMSPRKLNSSKYALKDVSEEELEELLLRGVQELHWMKQRADYENKVCSLTNRLVSLKEELQQKEELLQSSSIDLSVIPQLA